MKTPAFTILFLFLAGVHSFPAARAESIPEAYNRGAFNQVIKAYLKLSDNNDLPATLNLATVFKDLGYHQDLNLNLVRFTRRLLEVRQNDTKALKKLHGQILATEQVAEKAWLLEKTNQ